MIKNQPGFVGHWMIPDQNSGLDPCPQAGTARLLCDLASEWSVGGASAERLTDTAVGQTCRENGGVGVS